MKDFSKHIVRSEYSSRGGGIEINLKFLGKKYTNIHMTAYCNYLGGGLLGSIQSDCQIIGFENIVKLKRTSDQLKKYFYKLLYGTTKGYSKNTILPVSAY